MILRRIAQALIVVSAVGLGFAIYSGLRQVRTVQTHDSIKAPARAETLVPLPGTVYVTQAGALYRLQNGHFTQLQPESGHWSQPALSPDHRQLVAVSRGGQWSDLVLLDANGQIQRRLTSNGSATLEDNRWAFFPYFAGDGRSIFFSTDNPKYGYKVDFSIWNLSVDGGARKRWTTPNDYTGGDVHPVAVNGGIIYSGYSIDEKGRVYSQLYLQKTALRPGGPLTLPEEDCGQPALSPAGDRIAMICTGGAQVGRLVIASFDGTKLGPRQVLLDGKLAAIPTWSPDGTALLFLAPGDENGRFQLWLATQPAPGASPASTAASSAASAKPTGATSPSPKPSSAAASPASGGPPPWTIQKVTAGLDLDPTSAIAWAPA